MINQKLRLGIIGMSEGNGHPYSWSAICNGYDAEAMATCPFPVIPAYLAKQEWPAAQITGAAVTHVYTQDAETSAHIAAAARIPHVTENPEDMIGHIDALLLARDDAGNHRLFAEPFLQAGLPVYIDKPLAHTVKAAQELLNLQQYPGQLFTCSALRFSGELQLTDAIRSEIGELKMVEAQIPNSWEKYAIHLIDPVLTYLRKPTQITRCRAFASGQVRTLQAETADGVYLRFQTSGKLPVPFGITLTGEKSQVTLTLTDTFSTFKNALLAFVQGVRTRTGVIPQHETLQAIGLIEAGLT